jgi:hypothetical protein
VYEFNATPPGLLAASTSQDLATAGDALVSCAATYKGRTRIRSNDRYGSAGGSLEVVVLETV